MNKLVIMLGLFASSCETPKGPRDEKNGYAVVKIDSCEYIEVSSRLGMSSGYYSLTHKGNCRNPVHK